MIFNEYVKIREEKFGAVIFETLKEKVYVTNETGRDILLLLKEGRTNGEIINSLADRYNDDRSFVERDAKDFISRLVNNGLMSDEDSR